MQNDAECMIARRCTSLDVDILESDRRGWRLTHEELRRDLQFLLGGSYEAWSERVCGSSSAFEESLNIFQTNQLERIPLQPFESR